MLKEAKKPVKRPDARINGRLGGRPAGKVGTHTMDVIEARKWLIKKVIENIEPLYNMLYSKAIAGDMIAFKELMDRSFGKAVQGIEVAGKDGNPIVFMPVELIQKHALKAEFEQLPNGEVKQLDKSIESVDIKK